MAHSSIGFEDTRFLQSGSLKRTIGVGLMKLSRAKLPYIAHSWKRGSTPLCATNLLIFNQLYLKTFILNVIVFNVYWFGQGVLSYLPFFYIFSCKVLQMSKKFLTFAVTKRKTKGWENNIKITAEKFGSLKFISYLCETNQ